MKPELRLVKDTDETPRGLQLRDPVALYLASLSFTGRRSMDSKLRTLRRLLELDRFEPRELCVIAFAGKAALQDAGAAPATINATLCALKGIARAAWQTGQLSAEDLEKIRDVRSVRGSREPRGRAHSTSEIEALVAACMRDRSPAGARDAAVVALQYNLGLRRAECSALDLDHYSPTGQTIRVTGKGNKERIAHLVDKGAATALADWLEIRSLKPGPLLCPVTRDGKVILRRLSDQAIYNATLKRARAAGISNLTPHNLRRSFGTDLLERGTDIGVVKELLGHASINTTQLYDRRGAPAQRLATGLLKLPYENQRQPELPFEGARQPRKEKEKFGELRNKSPATVLDREALPNATSYPTDPKSRPAPGLCQQPHTKERIEKQ